MGTPLVGHEDSSEKMRTLVGQWEQWWENENSTLRMGTLVDDGDDSGRLGTSLFPGCNIPWTHQQCPRLRAPEGRAGGVGGGQEEELDTFIHVMSAPYAQPQPAQSRQGHAG